MLMRQLACLLLLMAMALCPGTELPRLCVLTDIGGDPDDRQSLIRLMVYANEFKIEGLVASAAGTPGELKKSITRPELIQEIVEAYGKVRPQLARHAEGWPETSELARKIKSGNPHRGRSFIGEGHDTEGSQWLIGGAWWNLVVEAMVFQTCELVTEVQFTAKEEDSDPVIRRIVEPSGSSFQGLDLTIEPLTDRIGNTV